MAGPQWLQTFIDFESDKYFRCPSDDMAIVHGGNAGTTYFFKDGKFHPIVTID